MAQIFLCHASEDKPQVREVYQRLKDEGFEPWLVQTFGSIEAIIVLVIAVIIGLSWIMTPVYVWRLYRKSTTIETMLVALTGTQSRRQQVERLQRDKERKKPRRRR